MNDMYREEDYRDRRNYRDDYRDRRNYRDDYDYRGDSYRRSNRERNMRNYREKEEYYNMLADAMEDGMELARTYEDISEMASNSKDKSSLMKIAEREKEHYRAVKEMLDHTM